MKWMYRYLLLLLLIGAMAVSLCACAVSAPAPQTPSTPEPPTQDTPPTPQPPKLGWVEENGDRYYYEEENIMSTGWVTIQDTRYYFLPDGRLATGTVEIDGTRHFFTSQGLEFTVVNPWNTVPESYQLDLLPLPAAYGDGQQVARICYDALLQMMDDCNEAMNGECLSYVVSGYRSHQRQTANFNNKIQRVMAADPSLTREEAELIAATEVARPGTSEHELGLAVDIVDNHLWALEEEQADLPAQKWLMEHCWEYGFVLRYPKDKISATGIIYEPWHYRYVGKELAKELYQSGQCIEEYLDAITKG